MKRLRATRGKPVILDPVWPNVGVETWYRRQLDTVINASFAQLTRAITEAWERTPPLFHSFAMDGHREATAAGVLFRAGARFLLCYRNDGEGWALPGGSIEPNETSEAAARREAFEETLYPPNGPMEYFATTCHERKGEPETLFDTFVYDVLLPFEPTLNSEHSAFVWVTAEQALSLDLHPGVRAVFESRKRMPPLVDVFAEDAAPTGTKGLQAALARWGSQTIKRFDNMASKIADDFAARNQFATQTSMMSQLKKAGFTVAFKPTQKSLEAFRAVVAENVSLIKSIPRKALEQVEQQVWNTVRQGSDLHKLSTELARRHKVTIDRAALIARDQNAKGKATIERVRQMELGITDALWMHSHAGKEPRPTHVAMNGKQYSLAKGMYDSDEGEWIHPGQLINCRCTNRPVIEGFD